MDISTRLDKAMEHRGIESQSALARLSKVPQPTINRILKGGGAKGPETETVRKLADALEVRFDWLNEGQGEMPRTRREDRQGEVQVHPDELARLVLLYCGADSRTRHEIMMAVEEMVRGAAVIATRPPPEDPSQMEERRRLVESKTVRLSSSEKPVLPPDEKRSS